MSEIWTSKNRKALKSELLTVRISSQSVFECSGLKKSHHSCLKTEYSFFGLNISVWGFKAQLSEIWTIYVRNPKEKPKPNVLSENWMFLSVFGHNGLDFRRSKMSKIWMKLFGFQTLSKYQTVWNWAKSRSSEIRMCSDFGRWLYYYSDGNWGTLVIKLPAQSNGF